MVMEKRKKDDKPKIKDAGNPNARLGNLKMSEIVVDPDFNARYSVTTEDGSASFDTHKDQTISQLAQSIKTNGLLNPLGIQEFVDEDGTVEYYLVSGFRRYEACEKAGMTHVPCRIVRGMTEQGALVENVLENLARADLRPAEVCDGLARLSAAGMSDAEIAKNVGRSKKHVQNMLRVKKNLRPEIFEALQRDPNANMAKLLKLAGLDEQEQEKEWERMTGKGSAAAPDPDKEGSNGKAPTKRSRPSDKVLEKLEQAIRESKQTRSDEWVKGALAIVRFARGSTDRVTGLPKGWQDGPKETKETKEAKSKAKRPPKKRKGASA